MARPNFGVIGLGRFGSSIALTLEQLGYPVMALEKNEAFLDKVKDYVSIAKQVSAEDKEALRETGIQNCETVIVAIGHELSASMLVTLNLKDLGVKNVIAKAHNDEHGRILEKIGAKVVFPEKESGIRLANKLTSSDILEFIEISPDYRVKEVKVAKDFVGKTLADINLRKSYRVMVLAVRHGAETIIIPSPEEIICENDVIVVVATSADMNKFLTKFEA
ncbi:TrkA family potassium uptake protein [Candidatus Woesearchaeota archaeon]|nr:TrkA family potassium uptake protein [Candidatus Woesearchaeota archaeon]